MTDTSGGVVPGATVTITHVDTGTDRAVVTNEQGIYTAPFLQIGTLPRQGRAERLRHRHPRRASTSA